MKYFIGKVFFLHYAGTSQYMKQQQFHGLKITVFVFGN